MSRQSCGLFKTCVAALFLIILAGAIENRPRATGITRATKSLLNKEWEFDSKSITDVRFKLARFDRFVPVIGTQQRKASSVPPLPFLEKRQQMFNLGIYPGVEYRIKSIMHRNESIEATSGLDSDEDVLLEIRPAYKLIKELERDWPVTIPLKQIPWCLSRGSYNVITIAGSVSLATSFLLASFVASCSLTLSVVNTRSMVPAIMPRDVMLVEKVSPWVARLLHQPAAQKEDIIFFSAPPRMTAYIQANNLPKIRQGSLLVKRVDAVLGGETSSSLSKNSAAPRTKRSYRMLGDNPSVSLDSRTWGPLDEKDIVGRPLLRVLPLDRFGPLQGR